MLYCLISQRRGEVTEPWRVSGVRSDAAVLAPFLHPDAGEQGSHQTLPGPALGTVPLLASAGSQVIKQPTCTALVRIRPLV